MISPLLLLERTVLLSSTLDRHAIPHAIGGALALGFHVHQPRATADIDVNVTLEVGSAQLLFDVLPAGVAWGPHDVARVVVDGQVRLLWGEGDSQMPLDLFFPQHELHGVVARRAERVPLLETTIPVLSATDLCIFKCLFDRRKDWGDIVALLEYGEVDVDEVRAWLARIVGPGDQRFAKLDEAAEEALQPEPVARDLFRGR